MSITFSFNNIHNDRLVTKSPLPHPPSEPRLGTSRNIIKPSLSPQNPGRVEEQITIATPVFLKELRVGPFPRPRQNPHFSYWIGCLEGKHLWLVRRHLTLRNSKKKKGPGPLEKFGRAAAVRRVGPASSSWYCSTFWKRWVIGGNVSHSWNQFMCQGSASACCPLAKHKTPMLIPAGGGRSEQKFHVATLGCAWPASTEGSANGCTYAPV